MTSRELHLIFKTLREKHSVSIETTEPASVKRELSRFKSEGKLGGRLEFSSQFAGNHPKTGNPIFTLSVVMLETTETFQEIKIL